MKRTVILTSDDEAMLAQLCQQFPLAAAHRICARAAVADPAKVIAEATKQR